MTAAGSLRSLRLPSRSQWRIFSEAQWARIEATLGLTKKSAIDRKLIQEVVICYSFDALCERLRPTKSQAARAITDARVALSSISLVLLADRSGRSQRDAYALIKACDQITALNRPPTPRLKLNGGPWPKRARLRMIAKLAEIWQLYRNEKPTFGHERANGVTYKGGFYAFCMAVAEPLRCADGIASDITAALRAGKNRTQ